MSPLDDESLTADESVCVRACARAFVNKRRGINSGFGFG